MIEILFMFAFGMVCGWVIEVIYRSFNQKKLVNPGFLSGPYLPLYGFGLLILYWVSSLVVNIWWKILLFFILMNLLELVTGIIFISYYKFKLWDYSKKFLNFKGLICLEFSVYWTLLSLGFYLFVYPYLSKLYYYLYSEVFLICLGLFYGIFILDLLSTLEVATRIRRLIYRSKNLNYYLFRESITLKFFKKNHKHFVRKFFLPLQSLRNKKLRISLKKFLRN
jgi:uncharacterized membrane protein